MFGLIKMLWKFAWLAIFILGVRRAMEIVQTQLNEIIDRIEEGEAGPVERSIARLHDALHHRQVQHGVASPAAAQNGVETSEPSAMAS